jgi:PadR family transcriptional regulator PadR
MRKLDSDYLIPLSPLDYQVLTALIERPLYGLALIEQCAADSEGVIEPGRGTMYPALKRLEQYHYIAQAGQHPGGGSKPRQLYAITSLGRIFGRITSAP